MPSDLSSIRVAMTPARFGANTMFGTPLVTVSPAGALHVPSAPPGAYMIQVTPPPVAAGATRWALQSVMVGGRDVTDGPFDHGLVRTVDEGRSSPSRIARRKCRARCSMLRAAPPRSFRSSCSRPTERSGPLVPGVVQSARPATNGSFKIMALPAVQYAIAAVRHSSRRCCRIQAISNSSVRPRSRSRSRREKKQQDFRIK